ncbi:Protein kinase domain [Sesbania bispinosa]|nr:Protein kinase domain [Sesbania bispinosa]
MDDLELPLFDLLTIITATNNFSEKNKIGEGGFGPVYWGKLTNGQEIAIKRLSQSSRQGAYHTKGKSLQWPKCFNIILGIARGLLYLHQDSRLRIVHKDLKAGMDTLERGQGYGVV